MYEELSSKSFTTFSFPQIPSTPHLYRELRVDVTEYDFIPSYMNSWWRWILHVCEYHNIWNTARNRLIFQWYNFFLWNLASASHLETTAPSCFQQGFFQSWKFYPSSNFLNLFCNQIRLHWGINKGSFTIKIFSSPFSRNNYWYTTGGDFDGARVHMRLPEKF